MSLILEFLCANLKYRTFIKLFFSLYLLLGLINTTFASTDIVLDSQIISENVGGWNIQFTSSFPSISAAMTEIGDFDGNNVADFIVTADNNAFILLLNASSTVESYIKITGATVSFSSGSVSSITSVGDLDNNGTVDIAVGSYKATVENIFRAGLVTILFLNQVGQVIDEQRITLNEGNFSGLLHSQNLFGRSVEGIGDFDDDGVEDLVVGANGDSSSGNSNSGAIWILLLNSDGTVKSQQKISSIDGNLNVQLDINDQFGQSITQIGDFDNDGVVDLAVGAQGDDDGGESTGAVYILFMNSNLTVKGFNKISATTEGFANVLDSIDDFGIDVVNVGDLNNDNITDIAVGAFGDDDGKNDTGAVYILYLDSEANIKDYKKISDIFGNFKYNLKTLDFFGQHLIPLGDINGDGIADMAVGAYGTDGRDAQTGAIYILLLNQMFTNLPPTFTPLHPQSTFEGNNLNFTVSATDPDNDSLTLSTAGIPSGATFDAPSGVFSWTPGYGDAGSYEVVFTVSDGELTSTATATIEVLNANQAPVLVAIGNQTISENQNFSIMLSATDPDNDQLTYQVTNLPNGATFIPSTQTFSWTPGYSDAGNYENIEFTVFDNGSPMELDFEVITITVGNVNRAPEIINPGPQEIFEEELLSFTVSATDLDNDATTLSVTNLPSGATFNTINNTFSWIPTLSQEGVYIVTFTATDDGVPSEAQSIDIVIAVGDNPTPVEQAEDLIEEIFLLELPTNVENSYMANLQKVATFIEAGNIQAAINQLTAFINKVNQDYGQGKITQTQRDTLISQAEEIVAAID